MFPLLINPAPLVFTIATTFGVLVHDMQIDKATTVALAAPAALMSFAAIDSVIKSSEHTHVERASLPGHLSSLKMGVARIQPRDDDRRYIQSKKISLGTTNGAYLWPSV